MAGNKVSADELTGCGLTDAGVQYVLDVCSSPPSRRIGTHRRRNLILDVPVPSLGVVLQAESLSGEFLFLVEMSQRTDLLAVFDQPLPVPLRIVDAAGRRTRIQYTADYLVVRPHSVTAYEIKSNDELEQLCTRRSADWLKRDPGYFYGPAIEYFAELGISHETVASNTLSSVRCDNLRLLASARSAPDSERLRRTRKNLLQIIQSERAIRAGEALDRLGEVDATSVLQVLDRKLAFAAINVASLSDIRNIWLATSQGTADALQGADHSVSNLLRSRQNLEAGELPDPKYYADLALRIAAVQGQALTGRLGKPLSERTIRRYKQTFAKANSDPLSLIPAWNKCGNRDQRLSQAHVSYLSQSIKADLGDCTCPSVYQSYRAYASGFDEFRTSTGQQSEDPVSKSTYYVYWRRLSSSQDTALLRGGRRLANALSDSYDPSSRTLLSTRAYGAAHIDHWKCDLFVVVGSVSGKKITARPWLTAMVDSYSGAVLAIWLSFSPPSRKSCAMVIRDCVRRHARLPEIIVVDGGAEFKSIHFSVMLATLGITRCERPPEDPRFGQEVERLFGHFKQRFARGLPGYGLSIDQSRAVSGSLKSHKRATLSLADAFDVLDSFVFRGYNLTLKPGQLNTRLDLQAACISNFPTSGRVAEWDLKFLIATSIEAPSATYTLWPGRGIHVNDRWYSSPKLLTYQGYKKDLSVRLEPYDTSLVYVSIEGKWIVCSSTARNFNATLPDRKLVELACGAYELKALRQALIREMDEIAAAVVNGKLSNFAGSQSGHGADTRSTPARERDERTEQ